MKLTIDRDATIYRRYIFICFGLAFVIGLQLMDFSMLRHSEQML